MANIADRSVSFAFVMVELYTVNCFFCQPVPEGTFFHFVFLRTIHRFDFRRRMRETLR